MTFTPESIMQALLTEQQVLKQGNRLIVRRYKRWHYISLTMDDSHISAINFMLGDRVTSMVQEWHAQANLLAIKEVSSNFQRELDEKVFTNANLYRPLLENGRCHIVTGFTSDTLQPVEENIETQINIIRQMMVRGKRGPYLSFR